ncbi:MAG: BMP family ABC transporter substrate-binding protein, partial [Mangrovicoccus sp.]
MRRAATTLGLALLTATGALAEDKVKAGFIYVGPVGDGGW